MELTEGKTKLVVTGPQDGTVLLQAKDVLTMGDAARVATIDNIGVLKTRQAANVFRLLADHGVPTAYISTIDERSMLCWACDMLPIEFVVRRIPWGSYLLRNPGVTSLASLTLEMFHKYAVVAAPAADVPGLMPESAARSPYLVDGRWAEGVYTDPYIDSTPVDWYLHPAKRPIDRDHPLLRIDPLLSPEAADSLAHTVLLPAFAVLEDAWRRTESENGPVTLVDCKFEVGRRQSDGALVLADVIDNDSWRIWPDARAEFQLDKQRFRDGADLADVAEAYAYVTDLTNRFVDVRP